MTRRLSGADEADARGWVGAAAAAAAGSLCLRAHCGAVVVVEREIIGAGHNSPPGDCPIAACRKDSLPPSFRSDRTCCVHAEGRAIADALARAPRRLRGSTMYFARLGPDGDVEPAGEPYCTICSKAVLDSGIAEFVLWHGDEAGFVAYDAADYNERSFTSGGGRTNAP